MNETYYTANYLNPFTVSQKMYLFSCVNEDRVTLMTCG